MTRPQKYRDVARFLQSQGWEIVRVRGSHESWRSPEGRVMVVIAQHRGVVSAGIVRQLQRHFPDNATVKEWN